MNFMALSKSEEAAWEISKHKQILLDLREAI